MFSIRLASRLSIILLLLLIAVISLLAPICASAQGAITGTISLEGCGALDPAQPINFDFSPASGAPFIKTVSLSSSGGAYTISGIPAGTYTIGVKGVKWLRQVINNVLVTSGNTTVNPSLTGGDANNDNTVDTSDFSILVGCYGSNASLPGSDYDPRADFNCDGSVDTTDYSMLVGDYGVNGTFYQIFLGASPSPTTNQITLTWHLQNSLGNSVTTPSGTAFNIYRATSASATPTFYTTVTTTQAQASNSYVDPVANTDAY